MSTVDKETVYAMANRLFWIFVENTHPSYLGDYIEADPDNPEGTRNTERGRDLYYEIEDYLMNRLGVSNE
jgi:hypothetical protein